MYPTMFALVEQGSVIIGLALIRFGSRHRCCLHYSIRFQGRAGSLESPWSRHRPYGGDNGHILLYAGASPAEGPTNA